MGDAIRVHSFAKINLALSVLDRRPDGFHEVRTVLQSIDLYDEIEFEDGPRLSLECRGLDLPASSNLVWKAACALAQEAGVKPRVSILLSKRIPAGAGLGGASGNAAATLLALDRLWKLRASAQDLMRVAARLGSDVPFFLEGGTALASGRGEEILPLRDPGRQPLLVIFPGMAIATGKAYAALSLKLTLPQSAHKINRFCDELASGSDCLASIFNDFETSILPDHPAVREAKHFLLSRGAKAALLSGSGSSVFGFFLDEESTLAASRSGLRESWRAFPAKTLSREDYLNRMFP